VSPTRRADSCNVVATWDAKQMITLAKRIDAIRWTNASVLKLAGEKDPVELILARVRGMAFEAMERGWSGPPYDPLEFAQLSGVEVIPIEEVEDARLVHHGRRARIEFNPNRSAERVRFSIAHELGHLAFPDAAEKIRYRAHSVEAQGDDWQVELLCNLAAAELLMPTGSFPELAEDISLEHLISLSAAYFVSIESALLRAVRLTAKPAGMFAAARLDGRRLRLDYLSGSRAWEPSIRARTITSAEALTRCTAVGFTAKEVIDSDEGALSLECVGAPPYPHTRYPRIVGLIRPIDGRPEAPEITYLYGDATNPQGSGAKVIVHVANDTTATWGGNGFAPQLRARYPGLQEGFREWAKGPDGLQLGCIHMHEVEEGLSVCTMIAQHNYGSQAAKIPLRYLALEQCLRRLRMELEGSGTAVYMPTIGSGQAGGDWGVIEEIIARQLLGVAAAVNVYLPPGAEVPRAAPRQLNFQI
jgi:Zn-dependent peptidase ImmA (M78 family)/O-acetyl-ADP-ribose deacetylase (regulator of RNase III)